MSDKQRQETAERLFKVARAGQLRLPGGQAVSMSEHVDHHMVFDAELKRNWTQSFDIQMAVSESFVLLSIEGLLLQPVDPAILHRCLLTVSLSDKPMHRVVLGLVTPHDSVLEARMRRLEEMVDAILRTEMDEASEEPIERAMAKRRETLRRLGYKPGTVLDHRVIAKPLLFRETERGRVQLQCPDEDGMPKGPVPVRVVLRGIRKLPVA